jgi:Rab GDP dissociation inhibitor
MGFFEKRKFRNFLIFLQNYDKTKPATFHKGKPLTQWTTKQLFEDFGLDANTQSFTGHAMALQRDDEYLDQPAEATAEAIQLYAFSLERYGKSPYIYPMYGLGGMPEGFSRLCAIHGGTFMLNKGIDEVLYENGVAWGVKTGNEVQLRATSHGYVHAVNTSSHRCIRLRLLVTSINPVIPFNHLTCMRCTLSSTQVAKASIIVGDPSYFDRTKTQVVGKVVRSICILNHPIAGEARRSCLVSLYCS